MDNTVVQRLKLDAPTADLGDWESLIERIKASHSSRVRIGLVGKYVSLHDAYLSVVEALSHAGYVFGTAVDVEWIDSEHLTEMTYEQQLEGLNGILVPGGFGYRGIEGKMLAARYAREHKVPYFGICLGMQIAVMELARSKLGWSDADSAEFELESEHHVIDLMPDQRDIEAKGGTMRLGAYPCRLASGTLAQQAYGEELIYERHRHRYELNNRYRRELMDVGMVISGLSPDDRLVEIIELADHPWFVGAQFHPEFKSRPQRPHPLFKAFVEAAIHYEVK